ncbi:MAG: hypothetical protein DMF97_19680 [Acidobacteria bacterium]|nr:MAG: hypothetical protein DMF97_19680 [Acidobacteriota bacterium]
MLGTLELALRLAISRRSRDLRVFVIFVVVFLVGAMQLGFIGLGRMGLNMVTRLALSVGWA